MSQEIRDIKLVKGNPRLAIVEAGYKYNPSIFLKVIYIDHSWRWVNTGIQCGLSTTAAIENEQIKVKIKQRMKEYEGEL